MSNKSTKLSPNFTLGELTHSNLANKYIVPTSFQVGMLRELCTKLLQPVRSKFGTLKVTSGLRDKEIYDLLIKNGYPASKTSDHFLVPELYQHRGRWMAPSDAPNPRGKGAADFIPLKANGWDVYYWMLDNFEAGKDFNQLIMYPKDYSKARSNYIHVSNPARLFIAKSIVASKKPVLVYVSGNKKFRGYTFVSLDIFKNKMKSKFKQRR